MKALTIEHLAHDRFFVRGQRPRRRWSLPNRAGDRRDHRRLRAIVTPARASHGFARRDDSKGGHQGFNRLNQGVLSFRLDSVGKPNNCEIFLNLAHRCGTLELLLQAFDLAAQFRVFERKRIGLDPAFFRSESVQDALRALSPPHRQMR